MSEWHEQATVFHWAALAQGRWPELALLHATLNGAVLQGGGREWRRLEQVGAKKGVLDICLPVPRNGWHSLWIELKHGKNQPTPEQAWWMDKLTEQGHLATVCWEASEAIEVLEEYLEGKL